MKNFKNYIMALSLAALASSCVDKEMEEYTLTKEDLGISPELEEQFEYVNKYDALKSYLKNPDSTPGNGFMLGIAVNGDVYEKGGDEYLMAAQNFQMVTFGNEMKYASVVNAKGKYNFDMVGKLVAKAETAGHVIIGHTLCWHEQSQPEYLNSLLKDKAKPKEKEVVDVDMKFSAASISLAVWGGSNADASKSFADGILTIDIAKQNTNSHDVQCFVSEGFDALPGQKYAIEIEYNKSAESEGKVVWQIMGANPQYDEKEITTEMAKYIYNYTFPDEIKDDDGNVLKSTKSAVILWLGNFNGTVNVKSVKVTHVEEVAAVDGEVQIVKHPCLSYDFEDGQNFSGNGAADFQITSEGKDGSKCFFVPASVLDGSGDPWDVQLQFAYDFQKDTKYNIAMKIKGSKEGTMGMTHEGIDSPNWGAASFAFTTDWTEVKKSYTPTADGGKFQFSIKALGCDLWIDDFEIYTEEETIIQTKIEKNVCASYDFEDGKQFSGNGAANYQLKEGEGTDNSKCFFIEGSNLNESDGWKVQMQFDYAYEKETQYTISMKVKGSAAGSFYMTHEGVKPPNWNAATFDFTTEWTEVKKSYTPSTDGGQFNINIGKAGADLWIDDFEIYTEKEVQVGGGIPLTAEEKRDTLLWELNRYIDEMFKATDYKVYVWDLLNEPMNWYGRFQSESDYDEEAQKNKFFWHTYLGDSFGADLAKIAREKYKGEKDLLLFINDYNLEASNAKLEGLIKAINDWDAILKAEGVKEIDGIASQCHISYQENPEELDKLKKGYTNALTKLSATGKLVRISEFDMGYIDANGNKLQTGDLTLDQHKNMAEFTQWCMEEYFKVVPANQQFGFTFWCPKDAPEASGWRKGEPVGIWTETGKRKPIYEGIVNALQNN